MCFLGFVIMCAIAGGIIGLFFGLANAFFDNRNNQSHVCCHNNEEEDYEYED